MELIVGLSLVRPFPSEEINSELPEETFLVSLEAVAMQDNADSTQDSP